MLVVVGEIFLMGRTILEVAFLRVIVITAQCPDTAPTLALGEEVIPFCDLRRSMGALALLAPIEEVTPGQIVTNPTERVR